VPDKALCAAVFLSLGLKRLRGSRFNAMCTMFQFPGLYGILVGAGVLCITWSVAWLGLKGTTFNFDAHGEKGAFQPLLSNYLDLAKFVIGLASGSIVLLVGSASFSKAGRLSSSFASPLFLLALSIIYGVLFMVFMLLNYEAHQHNTKPYTRFRYSRNLALGFSCLLCFCVGYAWLIVIVTGQP